MIEKKLIHVYDLIHGENQVDVGENSRSWLRTSGKKRVQTYHVKIHFRRDGEGMWKS